MDHGLPGATNRVWIGQQSDGLQEGIIPKGTVRPLISPDLEDLDSWADIRLMSEIYLAVEHTWE